MREPPRVRMGRPLAFANGHQVLPTMVDNFARQLHQLAEAATTAQPDSNQPDTAVSQIITWLTEELQHDEAWKRILHQAATGPSAALRVPCFLLSAAPSLYACNETWVEAAHTARRASAVLTPEELAPIRAAIERIPTPAPCPPDRNTAILMNSAAAR